jgi:hypothetical protein
MVSVKSAFAERPFFIHPSAFCLCQETLLHSSFSLGFLGLPMRRTGDEPRRANPLAISATRDIELARTLI